MTDQIEKNVSIDAPIDRVWAALTDPATIGAWMGDGDSVAFDLRVGGAYQFFGGATSGVLTKVHRPLELEYTWRQEEWEPEWPDSVVRWTLAPDGDSTQVRLTHDTFPNAGERDSHAEGWDTYWLEPMQTWLEDEDE
jgi:uncharacterized protein YndB with AHSA1/START domain